MSLKLVGKKRGMTRVFNKKGDSVACTVIEIEPNVVVQIKNMEKDGYIAAQLGGVKVSNPKIRNVTKPLKGHFAKAKVEPRRHLVESPLSQEGEVSIGQEFGVDYFELDSLVDVTGVSIGKGFQGVIKRHGFSGGPASHGSGFHRTAGSTGMRSSPGRTLPGVKMAGHMGAEQVTVQRLLVLGVDLNRNVLLVKGAVPGSAGSLVYVRKSVKSQS